MLMLTDGIAFVAAAFLFIEWRSLGERFLLSFAAGFFSIVIGCSLAPLREAGSFTLGVWLSNSMVPLAHLCFLHGAAAFAGHRLSRLWFLTPIACAVLTALPGMNTQFLSLFGAGFVSVLSLRAAQVLRSERNTSGSETRMLVWTFRVHGSFYALKTASAFVPGAFVSLNNYAGTMISISLFEGVLVAVALVMSIAGALRRRREDIVTRLADSDPLTGLLNRRGFESRAHKLLSRPNLGGVLLLIDVDHFKTINDCFGHQEGDRLLIALAEHLRAHSPIGAVVGRFGGDEFAVLLPRVGEAIGLQFAKDLCEGFGRHVGHENCGTLSIGCAPFGPSASDLSGVHLLADRALYEAKSQGRNRAAVSTRKIEGDAQGGAFPFPVAAHG